MRNITIELPTFTDLVRPPSGSSGTLVATARFSDCAILERRLVMDGLTPTLEYHRTEETAPVLCLSESADEIEPASMGIATMTDEGYWELTAVFC